MRLDLRPATVAVLALLALSGCSAGGSPSAATPSGGSAVARGSELALALDQVPDIRDGSVFFTAWSMLGRQKTTSFASGLIDFDDQMQRDLGLTATEAQWELDVEQRQRPPAYVLGYDARIDLSGLAAKLARFGYHADGSILTGPSADQVSQEHMWMLSLGTVGIDTHRHLLIGSRNAAAVKSMMAVPSHPLGHAESVAPLLTQVAARQSRTATAALAVGSAACVPLTAMIGKSVSQAALASVRRQFPGIFTPPQAEITAVAGPTDTTAVDALTFPDHRSAQANQAARLAASQTLSGIEGGANEVRATGSAVTERVLSFDLTASQPGAFRQRVVRNLLGVDLCP